MAAAMIGNGIHQISPDDYHRDPAEQPSLSASVAKILLTSSPAHAKAAHPRLNPQVVRDAEKKYDVGTAAHAVLLEGRNAVEICHFPDWRTNAAKEQRDLARSHGRIPLLADQAEELDAMVAATRGQLDAITVTPGLFVDGTPEQTIVWEEDGVTCRALIDWLHDDLSAIDDLKTTSKSANPETWTRSTLFSIGADVQAAFYRRGVKALTGLEPEMRFVVQETFAPYALSVVALGPDVLALAEAKVEWAIGAWRECLASDHWPAYPTRVCWAELPPWEESRWLEREARAAA